MPPDLLASSVNDRSGWAELKTLPITCTSEPHVDPRLHREMDQRRERRTDGASDSSSPQYLDRSLTIPGCTGVLQTLGKHSTTFSMPAGTRTTQMKRN
ncbi:hypothetical protein BaRGS_00037899 [Batillaria attramentaria]|uniref:Uncharacterized protein n=1 Tax=Batillaria attramentaria TaxID=370345 RepID=A0ABD0J7G5_9CAEN